MDYTTLKRKELQTLCKKHGIPANLTNLEMAKRLTTLINGEQKQAGKSCLRNMENDVNNVDEENKKLEVKRVRFSPQNETFEFEKTDPREWRLLARRKRALEKSLLATDPELVTENSVVGNKNPERNMKNDDGFVENPVRRSLRRKSMVKSDLGLVCEDVENLEIDIGVGKPIGRNSRRKSMVVNSDEVLVCEDLDCLGDENTVGVSCVEKMIGRSLRRKSVVVKSDVGNLEDGKVDVGFAEKPTERNLRRKSMVKSDVDLVCDDVGDSEKFVEDENVERNSRCRGRKIMKKEQDMTFVSSGVKKRHKRGKRCVEGVNNVVGNDMMVTRRTLRSRKAAGGNSVEGDNITVGNTENSYSLKEGSNENVANVVQAPRRLSRQSNKGKDGVAEKHQQTTAENFDNAKSKRGRKNTLTRRQQQVIEVSNISVGELNVNTERPRKRRGKPMEDKDLQERNEEVNVVEEKGQKRKNKTVEEDRGSKEIYVPKRLSRRTKLAEVDAALSDPVVVDSEPRKDDDVEESENKIGDLVNEVCKPNGCSIDKVEVGTHHISNEEPYLGVTIIEDNVAENKVLAADEQDDATGDTIYVDQKSEKYEDTEERTAESVETIAKAPAKNESPAASTLQDHDSHEGKSTTQTNQLKTPPKLHASSFMTHQEEMVSVPRVINTETDNFTLFSSETAENCTDATDPVSSGAAKHTTPVSSIVSKFDGDRSNIQNLVVVESPADGCAILHKSDDQVIKSMVVTGSKESSEYNFGEAECMPPDVCRADQSILDEKIEVVLEASIKADVQPCDHSDGLSYVSEENKSIEESDNTKTFTPVQNPEAPFGCIKYDETKVVEYCTTEPSQAMLDTPIINISSLFTQSQVDENCHVNEDYTFTEQEKKSKAEDAVKHVGNYCSPSSPSSSKIINFDTERPNIEEAVGMKILDNADAILDKSDDQVIELEGATGSREMLDNPIKEFDCTAADTSNTQRLDECTLGKEIEVGLEASVKVNVHPSFKLDDLTSGSPVSVAAVHKSMKEDADTKTITPLQNAVVGSSSFHYEESKEVNSQTAKPSLATSGSPTINISSLFAESHVEEQSLANKDCSFAEMKEEKYERTIHSFEESLQPLHVEYDDYDTRESEQHTELNKGVMMSPEDVEVIAGSSASKESLTPSQLRNGNDKAKCSMKTRTSLEMSTKSPTAKANIRLEEFVSTPQSISTKRLNATPSSSMASDHSEGDGTGYSDIEKIVSSKAARSYCLSSNETSTKLDHGHDRAFYTKDGAFFDNIIESELDGQVIEQEETPALGQSCDSISREAENTSPELRNMGSIKLRESSNETCVQPPVTTDGLIPISKASVASLKKPIEEVEETKTITQMHIHSVDIQSGYCGEDMSDINTSWLYVNSQVDDDLVVTQASVRRGIGRGEKTLRDGPSCFDSTNKFDNFVDNIKSLAVEQCEDGLNSTNVNLQYSDSENCTTDSDVKVKESEMADGVLKENVLAVGDQVESVTLVQDRKEDEVASEAKSSPCNVDSSIGNVVNVSISAPSSETDDLVETSVKASVFLKDDAVLNVDYNSKSPQNQDGEPSEASLPAESIQESTVNNIEYDDSEGNPQLESNDFGNKPDIPLKNDGVCNNIMEDCLVAANNRSAGSHADGGAVECAKDFDYWSEILNYSSSKDKIGDTLQTVCPAVDNELYWDKYMGDEDKQDVEGDLAKSVEKEDLLFLESQMAVESKSKTLIHETPPNPSGKHLIETNSFRQMGTPLLCNSQLSDGHNKIDNEGVKTQSMLASGKHDYLQSFCDVRKISNVSNVDNRKANGAGIVVEFGGKKDIDMIGQPHMSELQLHHQTYPEGKASCMTGYHHLPSETPGGLQGCKRRDDAVALASDQIAHVPNDILASNENKEEIDAGEEMQIKCDNEKDFAAAPVEKEVGNLHLSPMIDAKVSGETDTQEHDGCEHNSSQMLANGSCTKEMALSINSNNVPPVHNQEDSFDGHKEKLETVIVGEKQDTAFLVPNEHPFINIQVKHVDSDGNSLGERNAGVNIWGGEHGSVGSEECQIPFAHLPNHCDVGFRSNIESRENTHESSNKDGSFSSWFSAFEDGDNPLKEYNASSMNTHRKGSISTLDEAEENKDQQSSTDCGILSSWEIDLIYGGMDKQVDELKPGSSETHVSENENEGANVQENPKEAEQVQFVQDNLTMVKSPAKSVVPACVPDENKLVKPSSMIKKSTKRSILIHGTPKKQTLFMHDMKENATAVKMLQMVDVTAVKPLVKRRKALEDL